MAVDSQAVIEGPEAKAKDRFLFDDVDLSKGPTFSVTEAAKVFFGLSGHWMRWREKEGHFRLIDDATGEEYNTEPHRTDSGAREYSLDTLEKMAHGLTQQGYMSGMELQAVLKALQAVGVVNKVF